MMGASKRKTQGARVHADLRDVGVAVSRKTVAKLLRANEITGISPATWHPVSASRRSTTPRRVSWLLASLDVPAPC